jgi:hypothetical protein
MTIAELLEAMDDQKLPTTAKQRAAFEAALHRSRPVRRLFGP